MKTAAAIVVMVGLFAGASLAAFEPSEVRDAKDLRASEHIANAHAYYRALAASEVRLIKERSATLRKTNDAETLTALASEVKHLQDLAALHQQLSHAAATFRISAHEDWQPTLKLQAGDVVEAQAEGVWCSAVKKRATHTYDADGERGKEFGYLEGKVGDGHGFKIGKESQFTATQDGELAMDMHDGGKSDNDGVLSVALFIDPPAAVPDAPADQQQTLLDYHKAEAAAETRLTKVLVTALLRTKDPATITMLGHDIDQAREDLALDDAIAKGADGFKIDAAKPWQPTITVSAGMTVHVRAVGVWCFNNSERAGATVDADGRPNIGYLEARAGDGESFRVGKSGTFKVTQSGPLRFEMHDSGRGDNDGAVTVYVSMGE